MAPYNILVYFQDTA